MEQKDICLKLRFKTFIMYLVNSRVLKSPKIINYHFEEKL